jgi:hypothetical protein
MKKILFNVSKGKWSIGTDVIYLNVEDDAIISNVSVPVGPFGGSTVNVNVDADVKLTGWVVTPAVAYKVIQN